MIAKYRQNARMSALKNRCAAGLGARFWVPRADGGFARPVDRYTLTKETRRGGSAGKLRGEMNWGGSRSTRKVNAFKKKRKKKRALRSAR